jgi:hypothetical protein
MYHPSLTRGDIAVAAEAPTHRACLVAGCPCKDARIVSQRRARFFAARARSTGETADRHIAPEPGWRLPFALTPA